MAVYVDGRKTKFGRMVTSHMLADTLAELHAMMDAIGARRSWIEVSRTGVPHYDAPQNRRALAISLGAIEIDARREVEIMSRIRNDPKSFYGDAKPLR